VYNYSYRIALCSNLSKLTWVCHYCYKHKYTLLERGVLDVSQSLSSPARYLGERKKGHFIAPPSEESTALPAPTSLESALAKGCSQAVANKLAGFDTQEF
jgi:hypothetical protein